MDRNAPTSIKAMAEAVGKDCVVTAWAGFSDTIHFLATVKDVRSVYGRMDYLIVPVGGSGEAWVSADRVALEAKGA